MKQILLLIEIFDYFCGPSEDYNFHGEYIWVFSKWISRYQIYIKLQVRGNVGWVISFHEAEYSMGEKNA